MDYSFIVHVLFLGNGTITTQAHNKKKLFALCGISNRVPIDFAKIICHDFSMTLSRFSKTICLNFAFATIYGKSLKIQTFQTDPKVFTVGKKAQIW